MLYVHVWQTAVRATMCLDDGCHEPPSSLLQEVWPIVLRASGSCLSVAIVCRISAVLFCKLHATLLKLALVQADEAGEALKDLPGLPARLLVAQREPVLVSAWLGVAMSLRDMI